MWQDFDPSEDQIVVLLPEGSAGTVSIITDPNDPTVCYLQVDGQTLATLEGGGRLDADAVTILHGDPEEIENILPIA